MQKQTKLERLLTVIDEIITLQPEQKNTDTKISDFHLDSLDMVELMQKLEEEFSCQIDDDLAMTWKTIGDFHGYLDEHGT